MTVDGVDVSTAQQRLETLSGDVWEFADSLGVCIKRPVVESIVGFVLERAAEVFDCCECFDGLTLVGEDNIYCAGCGR